MTVTDVRTDRDARTITIASEFDAEVDKVWQLWADPRLLERWWGPPGYPATFVDLELTPGGKAAYYMTSPEGEQYHGWWRVSSVDAPKRLTYVDGFAHADGSPNDDLPTSDVEVTIEEISPGRTRMTIESTTGSEEAFDHLISMQAIEGMKQALGQIDDLLAG
jgi:uncharacterized protein YndB with AHSA1/START domain